MPILVDRTPMPRAEQLPHAIRQLAAHHAISIDHDRFGSDAERLISEIRRFVQGKSFQSCSAAWDVENDDRSGPEARFAALHYIIDHEVNEGHLKTAFYNRGILFLERRLHEEALLDFTNCIRCRHWDSLTEYAYAMRAEVCRELSAELRAVDACSEEINSWPKSYYAYYYRAAAWAAAGQSDNAISDYESVLRTLLIGDRISFHTQPDERCWRRALDNVLADLLSVLKRAPENLAAAASIGRLYEMLGGVEDLSKAVAYYRQAIEGYRSRSIKDRSLNEKIAFTQARDALKGLGASQQPE